jgi:hypothetical protein
MRRAARGISGIRKVPLAETYRIAILDLNRLIVCGRSSMAERQLPNLFGAFSHPPVRGFR